MCVSVRIKMKESQMTELVLSYPRFMRNLSSQCAECILCPSQVPTLTVNWTKNGLGDTGRHCPLLCIIHWAKTSTDQAGQLLDNQSFSFWFGNKFTRRFYFRLIYIGKRSQGFFYLVPQFF